MKILAIESTFDETAAALVETCGLGVRVINNILASSLILNKKYGGTVPEIAAREQVANIIPVIKEATGKQVGSIDAIAVSYGPGLMGSLLIGVETAKAISWAWNKPLLKVNHMAGHVLANWIVESEESPTPSFPCVGLIVSGGHTDIILLKDFHDWQWIGGTRDDAVGEAFDKVGRLLGFPYPGGPEVDKASKKVDDRSWNELSKKYRLTRPMLNDGGFDMSFSGIKAAVARIMENNQTTNNEEKYVIAREFSEAVIDVLVKKTLLAVERFAPKSVILAGGVAANSTLRQRLKTEVEKNTGISFFVPDLKYCGDNAAMIGAAALLRPQKSDILLKPDPVLQTV